MTEPRFSTQWERDDYERQKRGEAPLGPSQMHEHAFSIQAAEIRRLKEKIEAMELENRQLKSALGKITMDDQQNCGTSACPLCGEDTPHHHSRQEQDQLRGCRETFGKMHLRNPPHYSDDGDHGRWLMFKAGWLAARRALHV